MSENFNLDSINQYRTKRKMFVNKHSLQCDATFTMLDKNCDGKISKSELKGVSKEQYNSTIEQFKIGLECDDINFTDYDNLVSFSDKGFISYKDLEGFTQNFGLKEMNFKEVKGLKDVSQMSLDEINEELSEYGINNSKGDIKELLNKVREERSNYDENSNIVDGHIGTFVQAENSKMCTVLSIIETLSDEQVKNLYNLKTDENGNTYYEVTFPIDRDGGKSVIVTQEELDNRAVTVNTNGKEEEIVDLSTGDMDVTLLEIAYIKRFGTDTFKNGSEIEIAKNNFKNKNEKEIVVKMNLEDIENFDNLPPNTTIAMLYDNQILNKLIEKDKSLSDIEISGGRKITAFSSDKIALSDGTEIHSHHAMSVKGFDKEAQELIVTGNSCNSISDIRIPKELLFLFSMAVPEDFS